MPIILRNKTATIEIDINANLQHIVQKGSFDVTIVDDGNSIPIVWILFRRAGQIKDNIGLDWREISDPVVTSADDLLDLILEWNITPVNIENTDLIETLNELAARLAVLAGMANAGAPALRVMPIASVSTAVTGPLTDAQNTVTAKFLLTQFGHNLLATQANINNVVIS
jgi:hypothetical protein